MRRLRSRLGKTALLPDLCAPLEQRLELTAAEHLQVGEACLDLVGGERVGVVARGHGLRVKVELIITAKHLHVRRVLALDKGSNRGGGVQLLPQGCVVPLAVALLLDLFVEHIGHGGEHLDLLEGELGVEQAGIDLVGGQVRLADDKDLGTLLARAGGLERLDLFEELVEDPHEGVVVRRAEHLRDEGATGAQELGGKLARHEDELGLPVRVLAPGAADVGCAVVQHDVGLASVEVALEDGPALAAENVTTSKLVVGDDTRNRADRQEVEPNDLRPLGHVLGGNLAPAAGRGAEVEEDAGPLEEAELFVQLGELERGARAVPLGLGQLVPLVIAVGLLAALGLFAHGCARPATTKKTKKNAGTTP